MGPQKEDGPEPAIACCKLSRPPLATILFKNVTGTPVADDELTEQVDDGLDAAINQGTQILLDRGWNAKR
ncbi:MAG: hypothetical protein GY949_16615 [Gammaproteobacteria bacterium]|nr:hypothetical protein [Gammaproteobacteria bacterium]